jgi:cysteine synthase A
VVTVLCDPGTRYQSRVFNPAFLQSKSLPVPPWLDRPPRALPSVFADSTVG